jgi:iron complex transport system substrate-binding protein
LSCKNKGCHIIMTPFVISETMEYIFTMNHINISRGEIGGHLSPRLVRGFASPQAPYYTGFARFVTAFIVFVALMVVPANAQEDDAITVIDAYGEEVVITDASRIITIGGSVTEIVFALGAGEQVIARDTSSLYPPEALALPDVGYIRQLSAEPVVALDPTLIITTPDIGPEEAVTQLREVGVTFLVLPGGDSLEGVIERTRVTAQALGLEEQGDAVIARIESDYAQAQTLLEGVESRPRVMFIYARGVGAVSVAGANTSAATMIELAGGENAVTEYEGYRPITAESVVASAPDVILLMTRGLDSIDGVAGLLEQPGIAQTPASENQRVIAMDDLYLLGFSTRTGTAVLDLAYLLHEELEAPLITLLRADGRFNQLLNALEIAGQVELLTSGGPFTLFAPTDDAFASAFPPEVLAGFLSSTISVQATLSYHLLDGVVSTEDLLAQADAPVQTLYPDGVLTVGAGEDGGVLLNGSVNIVQADIVGGNGVIHVIDGLLLPARP